jgi:tetratricopeptide (TPR) repeat protein
MPCSSSPRTLEASPYKPKTGRELAWKYAARALAERRPTANLVLGLVRMKQERYAEAREALERAVAGDPGSPKAHYQLSLACARLGDEAGARKHVELYQAKLKEIEERVNQIQGASSRLGRAGGPQRAFIGLLGALIAATALAQSPPARLLFRDIGLEAGITFQHHSAPEKKYIVESMSGGVALFDFDNDGLVDVYFVDSLTVDTAQDPKAARSALYRNLGNGKFEDVTDKAGVGHPGWGMGVCVADVDGDGWDDPTSPRWGRTTCTATTTTVRSRTSPRARAWPAAAGPRAAASRTTTATGTSTSS